jgi:hypothetical protein
MFEVLLAMPHQKSIALYLASKGINATAIHHHQFATLGLDTASYPMVTLILRKSFLCKNNDRLRN